ncbi:hypothetical protein [Nonomuraea soli]|uniref:Nuclease n=1 Tax=Nonomuraea soli TaxID=1032476 RepID=A0A7W0HSB4_9ACTN|nr:hypothetical protein [Nonomuraea soli]MBA2893722.1 hypothetical protein [Nonomuraea soli]
MSVSEFSIDPWDPGYAAAMSVEALTERGSTSAELELGVEAAPGDWSPVTPRGGAPETLLVADGVRRIDARVWVHGEPMPLPGIAASYAAGIVRCGPDGADLAEIEVRRSLISAAPDTPEVKTRHATFQPAQATDSSMESLSLALQRQVTQLELELSVRHRRDGSDLLLVDGPLRGRTQLADTVGYIKTHHISYLPAPQSAVVGALASGQRTPVFLMGTSWRRHAWYLRLPVTSTAPWAGIARCEAGADLSSEQVVRLADAITLALLPLAGVPYKDPRAPQNLVPIGGLEKLLRHYLGDPQLMYRALRSAARG